MSDPDDSHAPPPGRETMDLPKGAMDTLRFAQANPDLFVRLSESILKDISSETTARASGAYAELLQELHHKFKQEHEFKEGELIRWKSGLKNKRRPEDGEPCIVIEVLKETIQNSPESGAGSAYFREPLDLLIGIVDDDKELSIYHVDSRRFEPYSPPATNDPADET
jgi:hypothetical protein